MRRWRREPLEADVLDALVCDRCGRSVPGYDGIERQLVDAMTFGTVATFAASWGYGSRRDGERWHADLCERCAEDVRQLIAAGDGPGIQGDGGPPVSEAREEWLRRAMGLGGPAPDPVGVRLAGGQFRVAPESERAVDFDAWHREGARARLATGIAYLPQGFCRRWRQVRERGEMLRGQRALAQARTLCYCSPHIHPIGETDDIEGWFTFGSAGYRLDIITPGLLAQATHEDWTRGSVLRADRAAWFSADWLLVPADTLDDELIAEAITRWYRERFKYQRGHWSHLEGRLPAVEINLAWEHPHKL